MLEGIAWSTIGVAGLGYFLFGMAGLALIRGGLRTDREVQQIIEAHKRELADIAHDRDEWRTESRIKDQQIDEQGVQLRYLAEVGKTVEAVLQAIHSIARSGGSTKEETTT